MHAGFGSRRSNVHSQHFCIALAIACGLYLLQDQAPFHVIRIYWVLERGCVEDQPQHAGNALRLTLCAQPRSDGMFTTQPSGEKFTRISAQWRSGRKLCGVPGEKNASVHSPREAGYLMSRVLKSLPRKIKSPPRTASG